MNCSTHGSLDMAHNGHDCHRITRGDDTPTSHGFLFSLLSLMGSMTVEGDICSSASDLIAMDVCLLQ